VLPRFRAIGVEPNMVLQVSTGQATVWPAGNWAVNNSAPCVAEFAVTIGKCYVDTPIITSHLSMGGNQNWLPPVP
jgi:hypothetical protein